MLKEISILTLISCLHTSVSIAGGTDWLFRVKEFRETKNEDIVLLVPVERGKEFPLSCDILTVRAQYALSSISKQSHTKALSLLKNAAVAQKSVRFGSMGEGFGFTAKSSSCFVSSKALAVSTIDGEDVIFSYFKWP